MTRPVFNIGFGSECPHCKIGTINVMRSKFGEFYGCSRFPLCAFTQKINGNDFITEEKEDEIEPVEDCGLIFK